MQKQAAINLSDNYSLPLSQYASQGNAILGIRDSGKSYTAMKLAEELLENNIPIIAFDPVGIWRNLKTGVNGNKGYEVVVAGGYEPDIPLTIETVPDIIRAAMKENVSLIIDLYTPKLSKANWLRIVQETVDILFYENKEFGLRHIFIEEAAEFVPQRVQPQQGKVYASLERLARMGRNSRLGYTMINQRAEEVNKAVLELCEFSLLHKQVGKNSLNSLKKWMDLLQVGNEKEILSSLPNLKKGECWAIGQEQQPKLIQVTKKKTFHPNPQRPDEALPANTKTVNVTAFVDRLKTQLSKETKVEVSSLSKGDANQIEAFKKENALFRQERDQAIKQLVDVTSRLQQYEQFVLELIDKQVASLKTSLVALIPEIEIAKVDTLQPVHKSLTDHNSSFTKKVYAKVEASAGKLAKAPLAILQFLATYPDRSFTKAQIGIACDYSPNGGSFNNAISLLNTKGLIAKDGDRIKVEQASSYRELVGDLERKSYSIKTYLDKLGKCEREIYQVLLDKPRLWFTREQLANETPSKYAAAGGSFGNAISSLNTLELIKKEAGLIILNPELLELKSEKR